ncbi:(2,3-dihydroxybenzoyl)adenylate synthase [Streptomyces sp. NBC_00154]|uniref:(2,3-dihydroxybenzoyl)adenylate synthase n=1 Tax=Streptomyces sp. NBC_00154 TaxID=2975670 RepID=UPI00225BC26B|nr:AMP-binding protein [Streptomyces sp. NBC_00154]MCX5310552.1 AMP-binding protein [Streptomyces sp. NBC_00154]
MTTVEEGVAGTSGGRAPRSTPQPGTVPWPAAYAARYRAAGHWADRPLGHWTRRWAQTYGNRTALVDGEIRLTYRELAAHADALAVALRERGLHRGDRILVQLPNSWEFVALMLSCFRSGVVPVLVLTAHREHELDYLLRHTEAKLIVVPDRWRDFDHQDLAARLAEAVPWECGVLVKGTTADAAHLDLGRILACGPGAPERIRELDADPPHPDDIALFLLSGGTTGLPKLIARTHNDYGYNVRRSAEVSGFGSTTVFLAALPVGHNAVLGCPGILGTLSGGGTVVLVPSPQPRTALAAMEAERVTDVAVVPAVARQWVAEAAGGGYDLGSLRLVTIGGSVVDPELARRVRDGLGGQLQQLYGMAEGLLCCTRPDDPDDLVLGTQGRPVSPDDELLVVDEQDRPVPLGEVGELLTRGPYTPRGYYRAAEHNTHAFTRDGWFRTGDLVRLHPGGNLTVEGRRKELINRGGEKVSAEEVENLTRLLVGVDRVVAVPVPDKQFGERVCLVVVPAPGAQAPSLSDVRQRFVRHGVAHYKLPEQLEILTDLPLTPVGKVDKKAIRERLATEEKS